MNPNILFAIYCVAYIIFQKPNINIYAIAEFIGYSIPPIIAIILYNMKKGNRTIENAAYVLTTIWMVISIVGSLSRS